MMKKVAIAVVVVAVVAAVCTAGLRRKLRAQRLYERAVAQYMLQRVDDSEATFHELAQHFGDLPIGALAELKIAFIAYDEHENLDRAEQLFHEFLDTHPQDVMYLSQAPLPDYEGELQLVAYYFLGRIAQDRGDTPGARRWFERIVTRGSRNPGNMIVGETATLLRHMDDTHG